MVQTVIGTGINIFLLISLKEKIDFAEILRRISQTSVAVM